MLRDFPGRDDSGQIMPGAIAEVNQFMMIAEMPWCIIHSGNILHCNS